MYRLLAVEDEEILRMAVPTMIPWQSLRIEVVDTVENGLDALQFLENHDVDIVLSDIRMHRMDGLALAQAIGQKYPRIKTVLFSAYSDFSYAQKAIDYGVYGYLLKSATDDEIYDYLQRMVLQLDDSGCVRSDPGEEPRISCISNKTIAKALEYIRCRYTSQDLSLEKVAAHVNVHPVYLSRLFRQEMATTYKDVLTRIRIEAAMTLLQDVDMRIYEISEKVGFKKPRYFSEVFKDATGFTPLEYRGRN